MFIFYLKGIWSTIPFHPHLVAESSSGCSSCSTSSSSSSTSSRWIGDAKNFKNMNNRFAQRRFLLLVWLTYQSQSHRSGTHPFIPPSSGPPIALVWAEIKLNIVYSEFDSFAWWYVCVLRLCFVLTFIPASKFISIHFSFPSLKLFLGLKILVPFSFWGWILFDWIHLYFLVFVIIIIIQMGESLSCIYVRYVYSIYEFIPGTRQWDK